jgi:hypothetical protein
LIVARSNANATNHLYGFKYLSRIFIYLFLQRAN